MVTDRLDGARAHPGRGGDPVTATRHGVGATRGTAPATDRGGDQVTGRGTAASRHAAAAATHRGSAPETATGHGVAVIRWAAAATDRGGDAVTAGRHGVGATRGAAPATGSLIGGARRASLAPLTAVAL